MQIHQVLVSASPGDAITNSAFELRELLRLIGPSDIFAQHIHPGIADEIIPLNKYYLTASHRPADDVLLYHAAIGDAQVSSFIRERPERLVLVYHNISPVESFAPYDSTFASLLGMGRDDLLALRDRVELALCDSAFNASELSDLGYRNVRVSRLIIDPRTLHGVPADEGTTAVLAERIDGPMVLFVGQILPHKRPDFLVEAYYALVTYLVPGAHLVLIGSPRLPRFAEAIREQIIELGLPRAWMTGAVPIETLRSFYERADVFASASDHEGFCVPLLEAMSFRIPIVARGTTAIPETLGDAGLVLDPSDSPLVMAEALAQLIDDAPLRASLVERGERRLATFDPDVARTQVLDHLLSVI